MSWKKLFGYDVIFECKNCNAKQPIKVPRGVTIYDFMQTPQARCLNCGCETLKIPEKKNA